MVCLAGLPSLTLGKFAAGKGAMPILWAIGTVEGDDEGVVLEVVVAV